MPDGFVGKEPAHFPSRIQPDKISQQGAACAKSITSYKWSDTTCFDQYGNIGIIGVGILLLGPGYFIIRTVPRSAKIEELEQFKIAQEGIVDGLAEKGGKYRQAQFAVDGYSIVTVGHILVKSAQV